MTQGELEQDPVRKQLRLEIERLQAELEYYRTKCHRHEDCPQAPLRAEAERLQAQVAHLSLEECDQDENCFVHWNHYQLTQASMDVLRKELEQAKEQSMALNKLDAKLKQDLEQAKERERQLLNSIRVEIANKLGGLESSSVVWGNSPYDKGFANGITAALAAFDHEVKIAAAALKPPEEQA